MEIHIYYTHQKRKIIYSYTSGFSCLMFIFEDSKNFIGIFFGLVLWHINHWGFNAKSFFFIINGFLIIVFIFTVISTMFWPTCPPVFRCLTNLGTYTELWTTSFIESTGVACSDPVSHNRVSIPVLLLACSQDWTCNLQMIVYLEA